MKARCQESARDAQLVQPFFTPFTIERRGRWISHVLRSIIGEAESQARVG